ncbi:Fe2OG dioxygenase domain-containing protein [Mycena chlorophos]|uniref:Fe2OG dioxygenase domain-containing protein n=1 Tax=Mycena chlorophos TaxID=658473 RepID=A0A8H6TJ91_MYCCL|nr:Fe2OG dioxygenase domain-containing protein [Mycena chlorophos]
MLPILDYTLAERDHPAFLTLLRDMLINGGYLYLKNTPVPQAVVDDMIESTDQFFNLPMAVKDKLDMNNNKHFNGYFRKGTAENPTREQYNYGDENELASALEGAPIYHHIHGDTPWPDESEFPDGQAKMREYYVHMKALAMQFTKHVSEALGLGPDGFEPHLEDDLARRQLRCKLLRYPVCAPSTTGFVPHTDSNFLTYLLQASDEPGLELQKPSGEWYPAPPIQGTFMIFLGRVLEKMSHNVVKAPMHRVMSPAKGTRHSVGFFQGVSMDTRVVDAHFEFPQEVLDMARARQEREGDTSEFKHIENDFLPAGEVVLNFKLKAHPLVCYRYYPTLFPKFFPDGLPPRYAQIWEKQQAQVLAN